VGNIAARKNFAPPLFFGAQKHFQIVKERLKTFVSDQGRASFLCEAKQKIEKKTWRYPVTPQCATRRFLLATAFC
jgi:hypothetical protein